MIDITTAAITISIVTIDSHCDCVETFGILIEIIKLLKLLE